MCGPRAARVVVPKKCPTGPEGLKAFRVLLRLSPEGRSRSGAQMKVPHRAKGFEEALGSLENTDPANTLWWLSCDFLTFRDVSGSAQHAMAPGQAEPKGGPLAANYFACLN